MTDISQHVRRRQTVRHLFTRPQYRESVKLNGKLNLVDGLLAGFQPSFTTVLALVLAFNSPWPHLVGFAALGALPALFARFSPDKDRLLTVVKCAVLQTFSVALMSQLSWVGVPIVMQILCLSLLSGVFFIVCSALRIGPPGPVIFLFAASAAMGKPTELLDVFERTSATGAIALLAILVVFLSEPLRKKLGNKPNLLPSLKMTKPQTLLVATRMVVASAIAALLVYALGANQPGWAVMGVVTVMQPALLHMSMNRGVQRTIGAILGAAAVWILLLFAPPFWVIAVILVGLIVATELVILVNYGLGQILVTPMALLMTVVATQPVDAAPLMLERVTDTFVGACIGLAVAILLSTLSERRHLAEHHKSRTAT